MRKDIFLMNFILTSVGTLATIAIYAYFYNDFRDRFYSHYRNLGIDLANHNQSLTLDETEEVKPGGAANYPNPMDFVIAIGTFFSAAFVIANGVKIDDYLERRIENSYDQSHRASTDRDIGYSCAKIVCPILVIFCTSALAIFWTSEIINDTQLVEGYRACKHSNSLPCKTEASSLSFGPFWVKSNTLILLTSPAIALINAVALTLYTGISSLILCAINLYRQRRASAEHLTLLQHANSTSQELAISYQH